MGLEQKLRKLQDNLRNAGWRIQHIPWQKDDKPEYYFNNLYSMAFIITGLAGFFGGIALMVKQLASIYTGMGIAVGALLLLFASRFVAGYFLYRNFVPVHAKCIDQEIREFEDRESSGGINKRTYWHPRILCEFYYESETFRVTPVIAKTNAFRSKSSAKKFLEERIDVNNRCTLWINPENPLHTVFHKKPLMAVYTV